MNSFFRRAPSPSPLVRSGGWRIRRSTNFNRRRDFVVCRQLRLFCDVFPDSLCYWVLVLKSFIPVDSWCSYLLQKLPLGYLFLNPGCFLNILLLLRDFNIVSAVFTEYSFGTFTWKCTWFHANPKFPNSNPYDFSCFNACVHVSM